MTLLNIYGSTGTIGSKSLNIIKNYFPEIKFNLFLAKNNYKKLAKQAITYKPKFICLTDKSKYFLLKKEINNNKIKIITSDEIYDFINETKSDLSILSISGFSSLNYIKPIIKNTKILGLVSKECIVAAGYIIKKLCIKYNTQIYPLDSEHYSIQNYFDKININKKIIKNIYLTASGGPFLNKNYNTIKNASIKKAINHPKWKMGIKNSIDSATLVNKCLEIIEAHYLFDVDYEKLNILIHPESLIHSIIELFDYNSSFNYFYHDMFIPIYNFLNSNSHLKKYPLSNNYNIKKNMNLSFYKPSLNNFPIIKLFNKMNKKKHENIMNFNIGNEFAVLLYYKGKITFGDITKIIQKTLSIDIKIKLNDIDNVLLYQNELIKILKYRIYDKYL